MSDLRSQLASGLAGHHTVVRELGHGGMATVFLATGLKHDRLVALKVLHPELARSVGGGPVRVIRPGWQDGHPRTVPGRRGAVEFHPARSSTLGDGEPIPAQLEREDACATSTDS